MNTRQGRSHDARDTIIGTVLLLVGVLLLISRNSGGVDSLRQVAMVTISAIETPLATIRTYRQTLQSNKVLLEQNLALQDELSRLKSAENQNKVLLDLLDFKEASHSPMIPVQIIARSQDQINRFFTIDAGKRKGVEEGMPVVHPDGVLGHVTLVTEKYAQVMPFRNAFFRISGRVQESRAFGILRWDPDKPNVLIMDYVPTTIQVHAGDVVFTSGNSLQFPRGLPIGNVRSIAESSTSDTWEIEVEPFVNLATVSEAFVMLFKPEAELLETTRLENLP